MSKKKELKKLRAEVKILKAYVNEIRTTEEFEQRAIGAQRVLDAMRKFAPKPNECSEDCSGCDSCTCAEEETRNCECSEYPYCECGPDRYKEWTDKQPVPVAPTTPTPCCGYLDMGAIRWNEFNSCLQCHNCGAQYVYQELEAPKEGPEAASVGFVPSDTTEATNLQRPVDPFEDPVSDEEKSDEQLESSLDYILGALDDSDETPDLYGDSDTVYGLGVLEPLIDEPYTNAAIPGRSQILRDDKGNFRPNRTPPIVKPAFMANPGHPNEPLVAI